MKIKQLLTLAPVIPVLVIEDLDHAQGIAEALVAGGLPVLEVTLRTPAALEAITVMSKVVGAQVGAGTITTARQLYQVATAGARFVVSPGLTPPVVEAALAAEIALLPGVATAADIMRGQDFGLECFKFFPAEASGGIKALKALSAPFFQSRFCPTGGITEASAPDWLALPSVICVGGSWIVPPGKPDVDAIYRNALAASRLRQVV